MEIKINIKNCSECPFWESERVYTADSFEMVFKWICKKSHGRIISGYVDTWDKVAIPDWCPCRIKVDKTESIYKKMLKCSTVYLNDKLIKNRYGKEEMTPTTNDIRDAVVESWDVKNKILRLKTKE
jgi:hypothetical protein